MFEFRPLDNLDQIELEMMVDSLQKSAEKQTSGSKLTLIAAAAAVGGIAYLSSPHGRKKVRSIRTKLAQWISPEKPMPMWVEEAKAEPQATKKEPKKAPTPVVETES